MHTWSEHTRIYTTHGTILSYRDRCGVGGLAAGPEIALGAADAEPILCAEVARLAQRVQNLEGEHEKDLAFMASCRKRVEREESRAEALQSEVNHLEAETIRLQRTLTERENAARETITGQRQSNGALQKRLHEVQDALSAERSRGQQYCLELAEKAEAIRRLRGEVAELREDNRVYGEQKRNWTADNQRQRGLVKMLEAAIEDGIAHVERARSLILTVAPYTLADFEQEALQHLDLAHEVLSKASAPRVEKASAVPVAPAPEARRIAALEADLRFIQAQCEVALAHSGKE